MTNSVQRIVQNKIDEEANTGDDKGKKSEGRPEDALGANIVEKIQATLQG